MLRDTEVVEKMLIENVRDNNILLKKLVIIYAYDFLTLQRKY